MHIAIITAGGAGMFCGSCMHDNTWARALRAEGAEISLVPTYTPIRVDEQDISVDRVFFGGINVYMEYRSRVWRKIPRPLTRWIDRPWFINMVTRFAVSNDASHLGAMTLAMLDGESGPQRRDVDELVEFLSRQLKPDIICFSNALLVGCLRRLKSEFTGQVYCVLQGDDIYLEGLDAQFRQQAIETIGERAQQFDGFLVHSNFYRDFMSDYLGLPIEKFHCIPLGIDLEGHIGQPVVRNNEKFTIGYFARICPEKGLHQLIDGFRILHSRQPTTRLLVGGYLGDRDKQYFADIQSQTSDLGDAFHYIGSPSSHEEKVEFLRSLDVLSVPTEYKEPKGIYVLEALANGVPVVQPRHGSFLELIESTQGGLLFEPGDAEALADSLEQLILEPERRIEFAEKGRGNVRKLYDPATMARETLAVFEAHRIA